MTDTEAKPLETDEKQAWLHRLLPFVGLLIFSAALWALHRELKHFKFADLHDYVRGLGGLQIACSLAATAAGYAALVGYDWFALRFVKQKLSTWRVALTAFTGYACSMNIGQAMLSGGAVRMRLYTGWGIGAIDVTRIIGFNFVIGTIGQMLLGGILFVSGTVTLPDSLPVPFHSIRWLGFAMLVVVAAFFLWIALKREPLQIKNWRMELPALKLAVPAVIVSGFDWALSGVVLYALLPQNVDLELWHLLGIVMAAHILSVLSMVPGGLGVFETVVIHLLPSTVPAPAALSALIAFRFIYYLVPFILAILLLGGNEAIMRKGRLSEVSGSVNAWVAPLVPHVMSLMVFVAGSILLLSGATPSVDSRMATLEQRIPIVAVELSHFLGSIVGVGLLLLASALRRRIDAAYYITVVLLVFGIIASLAKGLDYEEAGILALFLVALLPCHQRFHRKAALFARRFTPGWWVGIALVVGMITWIGFTAYQRVHYHPDLWVRFGLQGDASRFLRASAGIAVALAGFGLWQLLRPGLATLPPVAGPEELARVRPIVKASADTGAYLALLGDKRLLFSPSGKSALMFGIQGRTWITMGDPIGDGGEDEIEDLLWAFREDCDAAGARPAFYEVSASRAHAYAGLGMILYKLGEEARVDLTTFQLEGSSRKNLRRTKSKIERLGATFEILPASQFDEIASDLKAISDAWLEEKKAGEKSFSLGSYREDYLRHFDFAVIRLAGRIVAFANICAGAGKDQLSIDLMRHTSDAPYGAMEYLFVELMLWGKEQGYHWFSLGMAPLAGLENRTLAPVWNRLGAQIFRLGEHFYNFQGLRAYKDKFNPEWQPRYLACRSALLLPKVLLDIAALIGGGLKKSIKH